MLYNITYIIYVLKRVGYGMRINNNGFFSNPLLNPYLLGLCAHYSLWRFLRNFFIIFITYGGHNRRE